MTARSGTVARFLEVLASQVGYREGPDNYNKYAAIAGHANNQPWCATFLVAAAELAGVSGVPDSAYTPTQESKYKSLGRLHTVPIVGAQFFVYFPSQGRVGHTGIVTGIAPGGRSVYTIEGNSNDDGSREGVEVVRRVRPVLRESGRVGIRSYGYPTFVRPATATTSVGTSPVTFSVRNLQNVLVIRPRTGVWDATTTKGTEVVRAASMRGTAGWSRDRVRYLQGRLGLAEPDGVIGPITRAALVKRVKLVQVLFGVSPDGTWGAITDAAYLKTKAKFAAK